MSNKPSYQIVTLESLKESIDRLVKIVEANMDEMANLRKENSDLLTKIVQITRSEKQVEPSAIQKKYNRLRETIQDDMKKFGRAEIPVNSSWHFSDTSTLVRMFINDGYTCNLIERRSTLENTSYTSPARYIVVEN